MLERIYLAGPISGRERKETIQHFDEVESKIARTAGSNNIKIYTENPVRICPPQDEWHRAIKRCVSALVSCDGIALLQGWQRSKGATLELKLAQTLHIPVVYVEPPIDSVNLTELFLAAPETSLYYNARLSQFYKEGVYKPLAEDRALAELSNRYLDPHGFEYIDNSEEE